MKTASEIITEYKPVGEPSSRKVRQQNWDIAIGLQAVDNLSPSKYLLDVARDNIDGKITITDAYKKIDKYYSSHAGKAEGEDKEEVARVSTLITQILNDPSFTFAPSMYITIHKFLFRDLNPKIAGVIRAAGLLPEFPDGNIIKNEPIIGYDTVQYGFAGTISESMDYDFAQERKVDYIKMDAQARMEHMAQFISKIWQIHPFFEGNTRTTAVFAIKYLRQLGFDADNSWFKKYSKFFRNALVRANYQSLSKNIPYNFDFLYRFFGNMLLGEDNVLNNADMYIFTDKITEHTDKTGTITDKLGVNTDKLKQLTDKELDFLFQITDWLADEREITNAVAQKITGKSAESVKKYFAKLVATGVLAAIGERKSRKYKL